MKRQSLLFVSAFLLTQLILPACVSAQVFNHRITVHASVPQMRVIYIDDNGLIVKVGGNTNQNIEPRVYDSDNHKTKMTDAINQQYLRFLKSQGGKLIASKIYDVNPVYVSEEPSAQSIIVSSSPQQLSLSF